MPTVPSTKVSIPGFFHLLSDPSAILDHHGKIAVSNGGFENLIGLTANELKGKVFSIFVELTDAGKWEELQLQALSTNQLVSKTLLLCDASSQNKWCVARMVCEKGSPWIALSIKEVKTKPEIGQDSNKAEEELAHYEKFISHDLKAPLRHIEGFTDILLRTEINNLSEKGKGHLSFVAGATGKLQHIIEHLLYYSRSRKEELQISKVNLRNLTENVLFKFRTNTKVKFYIDVDNHIVGDARLITKALAFLIDNAVKFSGLVAEPRVEIKSEVLNRHTLISIKDNGVGFNNQFKDKLFQLFQRLHAQNEFPGSGLGLACAKRIIDRHHGKIWAESEENEGSTFFISFPS